MYRIPIALHAYSLRLLHPRSGEEMFFRAPLPEDFQQGLRSGGISWTEKEEADKE